LLIPQLIVNPRFIVNPQLVVKSQVTVNSRFIVNSVVKSQSNLNLSSIPNLSSTAILSSTANSSSSVNSSSILNSSSTHCQPPIPPHRQPIVRRMQDNDNVTERQCQRKTRGTEVQDDDNVRDRCEEQVDENAREERPTTRLRAASSRLLLLLKRFHPHFASHPSRHRHIMPSPEPHAISVSNRYDPSIPIRTSGRFL
jgi:hypothetical protein